MIREFFPNGGRIFSECADDLLETHLTSVVNKAVVYENEVGPDLIAEATDLRDKWLIIHDASKESTAQKADAEARRRDARAQLENELFLNLNKVVELPPNEPDQLGLYIQQCLLGSPSSGPVSGTNHNSPPATGSGSTSGSTSASTSGSWASVEAPAEVEAAVWDPVWAVSVQAPPDLYPVRVLLLTEAHPEPAAQVAVNLRR